MPVWEKAADKRLGDALNQVWEDLGSQVTENPSVWEVVGLEADRLARHAMEAISVIAAMEKETDSREPAFLVRLYCLGFIVGAKFGAASK